MKTLKILVFTFVFVVIGLSSAMSQRVESDSPLIGKMGPYHHDGKRINWRTSVFSGMA
jgi:hypothetical protein